jgi:hypothetical protein
VVVVVFSGKAQPGACVCRRQRSKPVTRSIPRLNKKVLGAGRAKLRRTVLGDAEDDPERWVKKEIMMQNKNNGRQEDTDASK